jgi:hypothetical protein
MKMNKLEKRVKDLEEINDALMETMEKLGDFMDFQSKQNSILLKGVHDNRVWINEQIKKGLN